MKYLRQMNELRRMVARGVKRAFRTPAVGPTRGRYLCALTAAGLLTAACGDLPSSRERTSETAQALVCPSDSVIPCEVRAAAITANTGKVIVNSASVVDSYDSNNGAYGGANVAANGTVRAARAIIRNGGIIAGQVIPNSPAGLAVVPVPAGIHNLPLGASMPGNLNINRSADSITLAPGAYVVQNLNLNSPGSIKISPQGMPRSLRANLAG